MTGARAAGIRTSLALLLAPLAVARSEEAPRGLAYQADASCMDERAFAMLILERTPSADLTPIDPDRAGVVVVLRATEDTFVGQLRIRRRDGTRFAREVRGASCSEVAPAIAFIVALSLSGQGESAPEPPATAPTAPLPVAPPPVATDPTPAGWGFGVGAAIGARSGIAPAWSMSEMVAVEARSMADSIVAPSFRLAALHAGPVTENSGVGTAEFSWLAARAAGCPVRIRLTRGVELLPCLGVDVGSIRASGQPATPQGLAGDTGSLWGDLFTSLRGEFRLFGPISAELEVELVVPLTRYQFAFDPSTDVYKVPPLAAAGSAGIFAHFP
jgi:hypothetical protein